MVLDFMFSIGITITLICTGVLLGIWLSKKSSEDKKGVDTMENRPPLGIMPYYIAAEDRIADLGEAISRNAHEPNKRHKIKEWATEIIYQNEMMETMRKGEGETTRIGDAYCERRD